MESREYLSGLVQGRGVTQMPLLTLTRCSIWPFNMTICDMTPAAPGLLPCHFLPNTSSTVSFPRHQMTGYLPWHANERKRGQMKRNYRKTGSSFPACNTIQRIKSSSLHCLRKSRATQQLLALEWITWEKSVDLYREKKNYTSWCHVYLCR